MSQRVFTEQELDVLGSIRNLHDLDPEAKRTWLVTRKHARTARKLAAEGYLRVCLEGRYARGDFARKRYVCFELTDAGMTGSEGLEWSWETTSLPPGP
jgi:hypothetical protein